MSNKYVYQNSYTSQILHHKQNGFFVEAGAADGKTHSNTLYLELKRSWTGVLIEPNPIHCRKIPRIRKKAFSINSCLSLHRRSENVAFKVTGLFGGIVGKIDYFELLYVKKLQYYKTEHVHLQCFTLYSLLLAVGQTEVDYFSLDVEGSELDILLTIPFSKVKIDVISVKYRISDYVQVNELQTQKKLDNIRSFFHSVGNYIEVAILPWGTHENPDMEEEKGVDVFFKRTD